jgi:hypothetical protein
MTRQNQPLMSAWLMPLALCLSTGTAVAQGANHPSIRFMSAPGDNGAARTGAHALKPFFKGLQAAFTQAYPVIGANADGTDLWPCVSGSTANPDCPTLGNPVIQFPRDAVVTGFPGFGFALQNTPGLGNGTGCDALVNGTGPQGTPYKPCAQITTWYDDNTNDSTDDLLWRIEVTQGGNIIYASGTIDFGPAGPNVKYPVHVVLSNDANLGYWPGAGTGPNNGNCSKDIFYPLANPAFPGGFYEVAAGKSCVRPHAGPAQVTEVTLLATPAYAQVSGNACTGKGVASPCYVVKWTRTQEIRQNFTVDLN